MTPSETEAVSSSTDAVTPDVDAQEAVVQESATQEGERVQVHGKAHAPAGHPGQS